MLKSKLEKKTPKQPSESQLEKDKVSQLVQKNTSNSLIADEPGVEDNEIRIKTVVEEKKNLFDKKEELPQKENETNNPILEEDHGIPKGFFDDPEQELKLLNPTSKLEEQEKKNMRLRQDLKIFNQFLQEELLLIEEDKNEDEDNAYTDKINDEIETMIELSNKAANLIKKSQTDVTHLNNKITSFVDDEMNKTLKRKRKTKDLELVLNDSKENKEETIDVDIFDIGWKTKGG